MPGLSGNSVTTSAPTELRWGSALQRPGGELAYTGRRVPSPRALEWLVTATETGGSVRAEGTEGTGAQCQEDSYLQEVRAAGGPGGARPRGGSLGKCISDLFASRQEVPLHPAGGRAPRGNRVLGRSFVLGRRLHFPKKEAPAAGPETSTREGPRDRRGPREGRPPLRSTPGCRAQGLGGPKGAARRAKGSLDPRKVPLRPAVTLTRDGRCPVGRTRGSPRGWGRKETRSVP